MSFFDPASKRRINKDLIPDALFGLEYHTPEGSRFRFFVVEADRATEPLTSSTSNRKSVVRSFRQYQSYIGHGRYREHLKLTAPLIVLNVCSDAKRTEKMLKMLAKVSPNKAPYQLFQAISGFSPDWRPAPLHKELPSSHWRRAGEAGFSIDKV